MPYFRFLTTFFALCLLATACVLPRAAVASVEVGNGVTLSIWGNAPTGQNYGPYVATFFDGDGNEFARTLVFCVERNEDFTPDAGYEIQGISHITQNSGHTLSGYAAWVYTQFAERVVPNLNPDYELEGYGPDGLGVSWSQVVNAYQDAIWAGMINLNDKWWWKRYIEASDIGKDSTRAEKGVYVNSSLFKALGISLKDFEDSDWEFDIDAPGSDELTKKLNSTGEAVVLNIFKDGWHYDKPKQDQIYIPPPSPDTHSIPEPSSVVATGLLFSMFGLGMYYRSRRQNQQAAA